MKNISAKDAKEKALGLFGYLKHLVKDPVRTIPEAKKRWKEVLIFTLVNIGIAGVPAIIGSIIKNVSGNPDNVVAKILNVPTAVGIAGLLFSAFLIFVLCKITPVLTLRECPKCKEQIAYDENVQYEVLRTWVNEKRSQSSVGNQITVEQTEMAEVSITCVCQNCGTVKQFKRQFKLAYYHNGTQKWSHDIDFLIEGFFSGQHIQ